jgi:hypothetical protein
MKKKAKSDPASHDDNPEWTAEDFAKARPASEMPDGMLDYFKASAAASSAKPAKARPAASGKRAKA